jgi:hypothetical protein
MYVGLIRGQPEPWQYIVAHGLKLVGGAAGGMLLARRKSATGYPPKTDYYSKEPTTQ